jgi:hypothetical protein
MNWFIFKEFRNNMFKLINASEVREFKEPVHVNNNVLVDPF